MNSASPTTSTSTNRGGRPKDWTEPRARRLVRLYIYTRLPFDLILKVLEDGVWKPGKDAANKVKNSLLGNDPRWIRPKDEDDERRRIAALRNSRRGMKPHRRTSHNNAHGLRSPDDDSLTIAQSSTSHEASNADYFKQEFIDPNLGIGVNIPHFGYDNHGAHRYTPWTTGGVNASRQGTDLTNSTETSMASSFRQKLTSVPRDQAKGAWRVLKQFTFPKDPDIQQGTAFSPVFSPGSQLPSGHGGPHHLGEPATRGLSSARYALPGDFLNADILTESSCEMGFSPHATETSWCWCRIVGGLKSAQAIWPIDDRQLSIHKIPLRDFYRTDVFGNTMFHRLASVGGDRNSFLDIISKALQHQQPPELPRLPIHNKNSAGQTFLHVIHQSWFDEEVLLEQLLNTLKDANFDILATDVYGRSFFHLLQNKKQSSARIPAHLFDWNLLKRRDAFGVKPMESRPRHPDPTTIPIVRRAGPANALSPVKSEMSPTAINIPSDRGDESHIRPQTELLRIVVDAVKVEGVNSTRPDPRTEDSRGRNALHCLAEVELDIDRVQDPTYDTQRQKKRKYKEEDGEPRPEGSRSNKRLEFLQGILSAEVDVNHYDNGGQTPLMAFIKYRPEDSRSDKDDMERIIRMLHNAGADLEKRNCQGETALHVAARSGKKVAMKELLQLGANPFVRDACGLSVLAAIDELWINTEADGVLTARLEACRGVFTSVVHGEAQEPTVLQEWEMRRMVAGQLR
ncbi:ankyrin [Hypomontagnella monticulosa]|nr:ankyrin [Hypomontagnella monticulosa]